jgi:hypothetical protein
VRIVLASILGGIALFMWGFMYWVVVSASWSAVRSLPLESETAIVSTLNEHMPADGVYFIPGFTEVDPQASPETRETLDQAWRARHEAGPRGMIMYRRAGATPQQPSQFLAGLMLNIASAFFVACMVSFGVSSASRFSHRYAMVVCFGIAAAIATHGVQWNWFNMPTEYSQFMMVDVIGSWLVAGVVIAAIVSPRRRPTAQTVAPA